MGDVVQHCVFATRGYMVAANGVNTLIVPMRRRVAEGGQPWRVDAHRAIGERPRRHLVNNQDILVLFLVLVQIGFYGEDVVHIWERDIYTGEDLYRFGNCGGHHPKGGGDHSPF